MSSKHANTQQAKACDNQANILCAHKRIVLPLLQGVKQATNESHDISEKGNGVFPRIKTFQHTTEVYDLGEVLALSLVKLGSSSRQSWETCCTVLLCVQNSFPDGNQKSRSSSSACCNTARLTELCSALSSGLCFRIHWLCFASTLCRAKSSFVYLKRQLFIFVINLQHAGRVNVWRRRISSLDILPVAKINENASVKIYHAETWVSQPQDFGRSVNEYFWERVRMESKTALTWQVSIVETCLCFAWISLSWAYLLAAFHTPLYIFSISLQNHELHEQPTCQLGLTPYITYLL